ncbi:HoxN/HupN/NixA family nickel/cobalt transporter [Nonomuraea sp. 10N515B]|uniref:HoxN/HupN/NixA family nickel/cobalt transporter n=1 Tax=Nonomuraea sp. 10N515B TaxID=3457422 RepID=UPI003FCCDD2E
MLVAVLNLMVLTGIVGLWRRMTQGRLHQDELERQLLNRGLMNRLLGRRTRALIRSSWHMYPVGILFGLGLETASEITLLALSASTAVHESGLPTLAVLSLPLLFAAGMTAFDTADSGRPFRTARLRRRRRLRGLLALRRHLALPRTRREVRRPARCRRRSTPAILRSGAGEPGCRLVVPGCQAYGWPSPSSELCHRSKAE